MRAPSFFWDDQPGMIARALAPLGDWYGRATLSRMTKQGTAMAAPVICVGNPVAGGAGKTPTALAIAQMLIQMGRTPFFLSRGYGGTLKGPLLVDAGVHTAAHVGDEPLLLASLAPTVVAQDRVTGAQLALAQGADCIVMDDGFQNPSLTKNCALLVVDAAVGIGNGLCLPAGPLRAPFTEQLRYCHGIILIGDGVRAHSIFDFAQAAGIPVFPARLLPEPLAAGRISDRPLLAFAGIGRPIKFARTLQKLGASVRLRAFPDHHHYTDADAYSLMQEADRDGLSLITTEKDAVRLTGSPALDALRQATDVLPVRLIFNDPRAVIRLLSEAGTA